MKVNSLFLTTCFLFVFASLQATTINPFPNLGEMAKASDAVVFAKAIQNYTTIEGSQTRFRTTLEVITNIKGNLTETTQFKIQNYHLKIGALERSVWGDLELEEGEQYLLFLDQIDNELWQAQMLSYAAFIEKTKRGEKVLVPFDLGAEVHIHHHVGQEHSEPLEVYRSSDLIDMLRNVVRGTKNWDRTQVATDYSIFSNEAGVRTTEPAHCTYLFSAPYVRWDDFDTFSALPVRYSAGGDAGCSNEATQVTNALANIANSYEGVILTNAGTHAYVPTCGVDGATGDEFTDWVAANLGGSRHEIIQFDDPCNEITDLVGCNGTLAIGGLYGFSSTHTNGGCTWRDAAYGYVVINNGTGACQCPGSDYEIMLTHELTHSLGIGHIASGSGAANMNPSCCNTVTALDEACLNFTYPPADLPVEVISFTGETIEKVIQLDWISVSELNNDFYTLERRNVSGEYETLTKIAGLGTTDLRQNYQYVDQQPQTGTNYYRLTQTDFDGTTAVIGEIAVDYFDDFQIDLHPNPVRGDRINIDVTTSIKGETSISVFDLNGNALLDRQDSLSKGKNQIQVNLNELPAGVYFIKLMQDGQTELMRFVKL